MAADMAHILNDKAWDGAWYLRGLMNDGRTIGSERDRVAKVWLNPQSWCVIADVASPERGRQAMDAVTRTSEACGRR